MDAPDADSHALDTDTLALVGACSELMISSVIGLAEEVAVYWIKERVRLPHQCALSHADTNLDLLSV